MNGDEQLLNGRVYGAEHDGPHSGPLSHRTYAELVGGPLDGLLLDIHGWRTEEVDDGVALTIELSRWSGGRALYDPYLGEPRTAGSGKQPRPGAVQAPPCPVRPPWLTTHRDVTPPARHGEEAASTNSGPGQAGDGPLPQVRAAAQPGSRPSRPWAMSRVSTTSSARRWSVMA
ncbi:putative protein OS=Streptomyces griseomycini OX=66895 GN=FHS37_006759 PE=4 SV=1 [Streptomyces griseomycini]|uniref:Uncharacterized protein n=1 Tax=Streptomyces griseomycini TaxID=66895 RepID=A0A7W7PWL8_9ACTN|nr:hypothetical protein [Streptomyces griseomycini]GGR54963.1 hypothetical protein GCM10015536_70370 [Streptomyces griseomycini]